MPYDGMRCDGNDDGLSCIEHSTVKWTKILRFGPLVHRFSMLFAFILSPSHIQCLTHPMDLLLCTHFQNITTKTQVKLKLWLLLFYTVRCWIISRQPTLLVWPLRVYICVLAWLPGKRVITFLLFFNLPLIVFCFYSPFIQCTVNGI